MIKLIRIIRELTLLNYIGSSMPNCINIFKTILYSHMIQKRIHLLIHCVIAYNYENECVGKVILMLSLIFSFKNLI